jgi:restriction endonuclease S subunit
LKTTSIAHLSAAGLAEMPMPVPPISEQMMLVEILKQLDLARSKLLDRSELLKQVIVAGQVAHERV